MDTERETVQDIDQDQVADKLYRQLQETGTEAFPPSVEKSGVTGGE